MGILEQILPIPAGYKLLGVKNNQMILIKETKTMAKYKIVAKNNNLAVHSVGYYDRAKAQRMIDSGECARYWLDKSQAKQGFVVVEY